MLTLGRYSTRMDGCVVIMLVPILAMDPATVSVSPLGTLVVIVANVIAIGNATIKQANVGPQPSSSSLFGSLSHGAMLGTINIGHTLVMGDIQ